MAHTNLRFLSLLLLSVTGFAGVAKAQDPLSVGSSVYNKLFENDRVRVLAVNFKPGEKIAKHSHPDHVVVVEKPGKLKISKPDGTSTELDLAVDQVVFIPAETHWAENTGKTDIKLIVTELKGAAHAAPAAATTK